MFANGSAGGKYQTKRSVRLRKSATAYFSKSFFYSTTADRQKWSFSTFLKRGSLGVVQRLLSADVGGTTLHSCYFNAEGQLTIYFEGASGAIKTIWTTTGRFRDPTAPMHVFIAQDTTLADVSDRIKVFVGGVRQTLNVSNISATYIAQNSLLYIGSEGIEHRIGGSAFYTSETFDGYLSETHFVTGLALTPESFAKMDSFSGSWVPKKYTGSYGTNGAYLNYENINSVATLGYDARPGSYSQNLRSTGTAFGGFTTAGGNAAAFDGVTNTGVSTSARAPAPPAGYSAASAIGKDWGVGNAKVITRFRLFGPADGGMVGGTAAPMLYKLQGSNNDISYNDLGGPYTTSGATAEVVVDPGGINISTAYRYHRVVFNANGADNLYLAELEFYESGQYVVGANNWTPTGISLTAGATYDSMIDVPLGGGSANRGNYCTLNPLSFGNSNYFSAITEGNLKILATTYNGANSRTYGSTLGASSGLYYHEFQLLAAGGVGNSAVAGWTRTDISNGSSVFGGSRAMVGGSFGYSGNTATNKFADSVSSSVITGAATTSDDIIMMAIDLAGGKAWIGKNGNWWNAVNALGAFDQLSPTITFTPTGDVYIPIFEPVGAGDNGNRSGFNVNFGQRPFSYTPPAGFKTLQTGNFPTPSGAALRPEKYFGINTYVGNSGTQIIINNGGFPPGVVWMKSRSAGNSHYFADVVRGRNFGFVVESTAGDYAVTAGRDLVSFNSNGFTLGQELSFGSSNTNGTSVVAWQFRNAPEAGFEILTYVGTAANRTIPHSLNKVVKMAIIKDRNVGSHWYVSHSELPATQYMRISTATPFTDGTVWNSALHTAAALSIGTNVEVNGLGRTYMGYAWAEIPGFSKISKWVGNGSIDGPFIYCGFKPKYILFKRIDTTSNWFIMDDARDPNNYLIKTIWADLGDAENGTELESTYGVDFNATGFKLRASHATRNAAGATYVFLAIAEENVKYASAR